MTPRDLALWNAAKPWLDVRSNDEHTLISYALAQALLTLIHDAQDAVVLPAILLHDTGWKKMPQEKLAQAVGPNPKYPELQRDHEIAGVEIGRDILNRLNFNLDDAAILSIVDGHDTTKHARSINDAVVKDADKLWRLTPHGRRTIATWYNLNDKDTLAMLEDFVLPSFLTPEGRAMACALLAEGKAMNTMPDRMMT
jgi:HD superfamily phosphohydrolase YqeK